MRTDRVLVAGLVVLGVLVIGSTAASYDAAETVAVSGAEEATGGGSGSGPGLPADGGAGASEALPLPGWLVENFILLTFGLGSLLFALGAVVITWRRGIDGLKRVLSMIGEALASGVLYLLVVAVLVWLVFGFSGEGIELASQPAPESGGGPSGGSAADEAPADEGRSVPYVYALVAGTVLLGVGWLYLFTRGDSDGTGSGSGRADEDVPDEPADSEAVLPAQEAVSDVPPSNPVYRAWREMAAATESETDGSLTANEVAAAAAERGLDGDAVRTLTRVFEEVRYGDRPVTDDRKRRAKSALESIEDSGGRGA